MNNYKWLFSIFTFIILCFISIKPVKAQSMLWIDGYKPKVDIGLQFSTSMGYIPSATSFGIKGGIIINNSEKRLGLRAGTSYNVRFNMYGDSIGFTTNSSFLAVIELTYKLGNIKNKPFIVGLGLIKSSYWLNPFKYPSHIIQIDFDMLVSVKKHISNNIYFEILVGTTIGNHPYWTFPNPVKYYWGAVFSANYVLSFKKSTP